jgi:chloramphenicol 3-O-phosphotransferase
VPPAVTEPALFLLTGVSAAGKSTVAQLLAERFSPSAHVRGDAFRRMIVHPAHRLDPEHPDEVEAHLRLRYAQMATTVERFHDAGFTVVAQDVIVGPLLAEAVAGIRRRPLHLVVLVPDRDVVAAREEGRAKTAYGPGRHTLDDLDRALREDTPRLGLWLDTSTQTPDETVTELLGRLDEARLA